MHDCIGGKSYLCQRHYEFTTYHSYHAPQAFIWLPASPTQTKGILWRKPWYTEREEAIMVNVSLLFTSLQLSQDIHLVQIV